MEPAGSLQALTFDLQGETFALEATLVREILDPTPETPVPGASALVGAVMNFRGRVIPLADLRLAFGMPAAEVTADSRIVVIELDIEGEATLIGLRTDRVNEVKALAFDSSETAPDIGMRYRPDYVRRLFKQAQDLVILPDLHCIFSSRRAADAASARRSA
jgi:purine-binding chemotaxis protein CheW